MKNVLRKKNGITLVVLIITVIIILILAGVAISVLTDDREMFGKTQNVVDQYERASEDENAILSNLVNYINKYFQCEDDKPIDVTLNPVIEKYYTVGFKVNVPEKMQGNNYIYYIGENSYESIERTIEILDLEPEQQYDIQIGVIDENGNVIQLSNKINGKTVPRKEVVL